MYYTAIVSPAITAASTSYTSCVCLAIRLMEYPLRSPYAVPVELLFVPPVLCAPLSSPNRKYLWILSRDRFIQKEVFQKYMRVAKEQGFDVSSLVYELSALR